MFYHRRHLLPCRRHLLHILVLLGRGGARQHYESQVLQDLHVPLSAQTSRISWSWGLTVVV